MKDEQYLSNVVTVGAADAEVGNRARDSIDAVELKANEQLTSAKAAQIANTAALLPTLRGNEFVEALTRFRDAVRGRLETHPEQLKPFLAERTIPDQLRKSRARVREMVRNAARAQWKFCS